jgi:hypothetical protein
MRRTRLASVCLILPLTFLVSACGGSSKPNTARSASPGGEASGPLTLVDQLPPINQFPSLRPISQPTVISSPAVWVSSGGLPGTPGQTEARRLSGMGFVAGVREELGSNQPAVAEVDAEVEQFRSAAAADTELSYSLDQARATGRSPGYKFARLKVAGVPGARGYAIKQAATSTDAVAFTSGTKFYLIESVLPSGSGHAVAPRQLSAEARAWYHHLQTL